MKTYKELNAERIILLQKEEKLKETKKIFEDREIRVGGVPPSLFWNIFDEYIEDLGNQQSILWHDMLALQENCEHDWEYEGRDSHYSYVVCKICGKSEKE